MHAMRLARLIPALLLVAVGGLSGCTVGEPAVARPSAEADPAGPADAAAPVPFEALGTLPGVDDFDAFVDWLDPICDGQLSSTLDAPDRKSMTCTDAEGQYVYEMTWWDAGKAIRDVNEVALPDEERCDDPGVLWTENPDLRAASAEGANWSLYTFTAEDVALDAATRTGAQFQRLIDCSEIGGGGLVIDTP